MPDDFVGKFLSGYADAASSKARLKTATYISPAKLAERRFYWEATTDDGDVIEIAVPLPKNIISDAFSFFFLAAYNFLFIEDLLEKAPAETKGEFAEAILGTARTRAAEEFKLRQQGQTYLEYLFYILWNQDEAEVRDAIIQVSQKGEWVLMFKLIPSPKVHSYVVGALEKFKLEHIDALVNLIPLALDLYLYVNSLRKPEVRKIDEEGVKERAETVARWL